MDNEPNTPLEIDGSPAVRSVVIDGIELIETEDGRAWYWDDQSFRIEPGTPLVPSGDWKEYHPPYEE